MNCHVFIEKPITSTIQEADLLLKLANKQKKIIQVGHIEQFNPAFNAIDLSNIKPTFIEAHRLSPFPNRGTDVPVVLDLMIHDIGVILSIVRKEVKEIRAFGQSIVSDTTDLANARIEFINGCVVNLTTSRISFKKMRKMRIFQNHRYVNIDFLNKTVDDYKSFNKKPDNNSQNKIFTIDGPNKKYIKHNQIYLETDKDDFLDVILFLKTNLDTKFRQLIDITVVDYPENNQRFQVVYLFLSHEFNQRLVLKYSISENEVIPSLTSIFPAANWMEREVFDMYGVNFKDHPDLRRILTDYGFEGHPLRKDFPLTGHSEVRYSEDQKKVISEPVKLEQNYRNFDYESPWEGTKYIKEEIENNDKKN